jgi:hypothetical protein
MAPTDRRFDQLDGVPLHYWRWTDGTAGQRTARRTFQSSAAFHDRLVRWVRDLRTIAQQHGGLTGMDRIISAGAYVNKPGQHGLGQAFDLDQVRWSNGTITPYHREHAARDLRVRRRYLALDAVCRRHFRFVLDGGFNAAHADHLHLDVGGGQIRCDKASRSDTAFVQMCCNAFLGSGLAVDGAWGARTQSAFAEASRRLGTGGDPHRVTVDWQRWLGRAAACGFGNRPFQAPPASRPAGDPVGDLVEDLLGPTLRGLGG